MLRHPHIARFDQTLHVCDANKYVSYSLKQGLTMAPKPPAQKLLTLALDRAPRSIVLVATLELR